MNVNARLIVQLRNRKSWSQEELGLAAGLNLRTIQRIENEGSASLQSRKALASVLEIDVQDLEYKESPAMKKYEYKTIELPVKSTFLKVDMPDVERALNVEADEGWRLHQVLLPASGNYGKTAKLLAILERQRT